MHGDQRQVVSVGEVLELQQRGVSVGVVAAKHDLAAQLRQGVHDNQSRVQLLDLRLNGCHRPTRRKAVIGDDRK